MSNLTMNTLLLIATIIATTIATTGEPLAGCYGNAYIYDRQSKKGENSIKVQIPNRPVATGKFDADTNKGKVDFTDDQKYKMTFNPSTGIIDWDGLERPWSGDKRREWDGTNNWQKTMPDIGGTYNHITDTDTNCDIDIYRTTGNKIKVDWSGCNNRPMARGYVNCPTGTDQPFTGQVTFPDDKMYTLAYFADEGKIYWDGASGPDDTNNIWILDQSLYQSEIQYASGHYYDFFDLWEIEEMDDDIDNDETEYMVQLGIINKAKSMVFNGSGVILLIIIMSVLYFGYKMMKTTNKENKYQTLN